MWCDAGLHLLEHLQHDADLVQTKTFEHIFRIVHTNIKCYKGLDYFIAFTFNHVNPSCEMLT